MNLIHENIHMFLFIIFCFTFHFICHVFTPIPTPDTFQFEYYCFVLLLVIMYFHFNSLISNTTAKMSKFHFYQKAFTFNLDERWMNFLFRNHWNWWKVEIFQTKLLCSWINSYYVIVQDLKRYLCNRSANYLYVSV